MHYAVTGTTGRSLEPGPVEEVETVRRMFRMFVYEEKHQREIAAILNKEQIRTDLGRRWTAGSVQQVLTNEKYIGNNVFNRASAKLTNKRIANPPEMWVRAIGAFPAISTSRRRASASRSATRSFSIPTASTRWTGFVRSPREHT